LSFLVEDNYVELQEGVDEAAQLNQLNPLTGWHPTLPGYEFMSDPALVKALRGPTQFGKTETGVAELLHRMRGTHPYLKTHTPPIDCWVVCTSWGQSLTIQRKIWALIPKDELSEDTRFSNKNGFTGHYFALKNGSTCTIVTAGQETIELASATLHYIWVDEPALEKHWGELTSRVFHHQGVIGLTFTPINRPVEWLKKKCEDGEIADHHFVMSEKNATPMGLTIPFRSQAAIDRYRNSILAIDRAQRCGAAWEGTTGERVWQAFTEDMIRDEYPPGEATWCVGIDHGAKAGRQIAVLVGCMRLPGAKRPSVWVVDEARSDERTGQYDDAKLILAMLRRNDLSVKDIDLWRGDRAHGGDFQGNKKTNRDLKKAIATVLGLSSVHKLPEALYQIRTPHKFDGSVSYGTTLVNKLMADERFTIRPDAVTTIDGIRHWEGAKQDPKKDPCDAMRYACEAVLDAAYGGSLRRYAA
jgi:hypothetical protein